MDNLDKTFKPTVEWMTAKYAEMNDQLFNGSLGECNFNIFTSGKGSEGGTLGWFKIAARGVKVDRYSRRMFKLTYGWGDRIYIDRKNFVQMCQPTIELNGNYTGTEHGFLATLVHEMCHYYTYMYGYAPKQGHGPEFREIGYAVSSRSNGLFTVQRLATAEEMSELELSDEMKAKRERRLANKKASVTAILVYTQEGLIKLTISSSQNLINMITKTESNERNNKVITSNDAEVIDFLFSKGFRKNMRSWRYWSIEGKPWINELNTLLNQNGNEIQAEPKKEEPKKQEVNYRKPVRMFSIKTSNGVFEYNGETYVGLFKALQQRFPNMSVETIKKIMNNPANYRTVNESNMNTKSIIQEVLDEFMQNEFRGADNLDDVVEINPNMNLGKYSPLEL